MILIQGVKSNPNECANIHLSVTLIYVKSSEVLGVRACFSVGFCYKEIIRGQQSPRISTKCQLCACKWAI